MHATDREYLSLSKFLRVCVLIYIFVSIRTMKLLDVLGAMVALTFVLNTSHCMPLRRKNTFRNNQTRFKNMQANPQRNATIMSLRPTQFGIAFRRTNRSPVEFERIFCKSNVTSQKHDDATKMDDQSSTVDRTQFIDCLSISWPVIPNGPGQTVSNVGLRRVGDTTEYTVAETERPNFVVIMPIYYYDVDQRYEMVYHLMVVRQLVKDIGTPLVRGNLRYINDIADFLERVEETNAM